MKYQFSCGACGSLEVVHVSAAKLNDPDWNLPNTVECTACGFDADRVYTTNAIMMDKSDATEVQHVGNSTSGSSKLQFVGQGFPDVEARLDKQEDEMNSIMDEDITPEEMEAGKAMMEELEIEKGYEKGKISGEREMETLEMEAVSDEEMRKEAAQRTKELSSLTGCSEQNVVKVSTADLREQGMDMEEGQRKVLTQRTKRRGEDKLREEAKKQGLMRRS